MELTSHYALFVKALEFLAEPAVRRAVRSGSLGPAFFTGDELEKLAEVLAAALAAADLQARVAVRAMQTAFLRRIARSRVDVQESRRLLLCEEAATPSPPERAVEFFRRLVPTLGTDPQRFGADMRRRAFTLAVATNRQLLGRVQRLIADRVRTGQGFSTAPADIKDLLDQAGVTPRNPQYAQAVFRTNVRDAQIQAATDELQDPDMQDAFPVWEYIHATGNPSDPNARPEHARRHRLLYPSSVPFVQVRGTGAEDAINCRCNFRPIDKFTWSRMKKAGRRIADDYPDVPSIDELRQQRQRTITREPGPELPREPEFPTRAEAPQVMPAVAQVTAPSPIAAIYSRAATDPGLRFQDIRAFVQSLKGQTKAELASMAREVDVTVAASYSKSEILRLIQDSIESRKTRAERTEYDRGAQQPAEAPAQQVTGDLPPSLRRLQRQRDDELRRIRATPSPILIGRTAYGAEGEGTVAGAIRRVGDQIADLSYDDLTEITQRLVAPMPAADAVALARQLGLRVPRNRREVIDAITQMLHQRKESFERIAGIGQGGSDAPMPQAPDLGVQFRPFTGGSRVVVQLAGDAVRVQPFDAGTAPIDVQPGGNYNGWTYGELRALGNGTHFLRRR